MTERGAGGRDRATSSKAGWTSWRSPIMVAPLLAFPLLAGCAIDADEEAGPHRTLVHEDLSQKEGLDRPRTRPIFAKDRFVEPAPAPPPSAYAHLDPSKIVPRVLLDKAVAYFDANQPAITNRNFITVVDFKRHSGEKRFFVIDMKSGVVRAHVTAHGKMSDPDSTGYATDFSNVPESNKSSVGFAVTGETYSGAHGRSLRLEGLSATNSNMYDRAIVIHSADYVVEGQPKQGRSLGCFVLDEDVKDDVIDLIEGGSLVYADVST